jgi:hypothetical protein
MTPPETMSDLTPTPMPGGEFLFYQSDDGRIRLQVRLESESVWLTQKLMAELFQKDVRTINEHIQNIFEEGELLPDSVIRKFRITAADGKNYETAHYNLDVIISVGYRVKSQRGTQFRIWATQRLREYIVKGFTMDEGTEKTPATWTEEETMSYTIKKLIPAIGQEPAARFCRKSQKRTDQITRILAALRVLGHIA